MQKQQIVMEFSNTDLMHAVGSGKGREQGKQTKYANSSKYETSDTYRLETHKCRHGVESAKAICPIAFATCDLELHANWMPAILLPANEQYFQRPVPDINTCVTRECHICKFSLVWVDSFLPSGHLILGQNGGVLSRSRCEFFHTCKCKLAICA